jgi:hypothetical protein
MKYLKLNHYYDIEYEKNRKGAHQIIVKPNCKLYDKCVKEIHDPNYMIGHPISCFESKIWLRVTGDIKKTNRVIFVTNDKGKIECYFEGTLPFSTEQYLNESKIIKIFCQKLKTKK